MWRDKCGEDGLQGQEDKVGSEETKADKKYSWKTDM